ncbi:hypothetical protein G5V59_03830 [Nocardioides sp. W3-2-3]|uniref:hypothetical protein n=1 Tax=Nocardioides convexus TaxID=2712224 RepID=UPI00241835A5|nr:hypothetical protein [Nocardioides convexus]NGZ99765.1 hypothetical protein [Nocardioides convexus]
MLAAEPDPGLPELDSFFRAHRSLARSRRLSAEAFGAAETHYVTTGTTGANQIALEALHSGTARVLVDRSMHQSIHFALDRLAARVEYAPTAADTAEHGVITALRRARAEDVRHDVVVIGVSAYDGSLVQMRRFLHALHEPDGGHRHRGARRRGLDGDPLLPPGDAPQRRGGLHPRDAGGPSGLVGVLPRDPVGPQVDAGPAPRLLRPPARLPRPAPPACVPT